MTPEEYTAELEVYEHVAEYTAQLRGLSIALKEALRAAKESPQEGDVPTALAMSIEQATECLEAMIEGYYHPRSGACFQDSECGLTTA